MHTRAEAPLKVAEQGERKRGRGATEVTQVFMHGCIVSSEPQKTTMNRFMIFFRPKKSMNRFMIFFGGQKNP